MHIARVQVEEGFLNGLDLRLTPGLNVLIGPRGSGKTSVIELIRFCLGAPSFTDKAAAAGRDHARSILGSGQVTVTVVADGREILVSRTAVDEAGRTTGHLPVPTVLSQNEIETVGLDALGRLRLIDAFRADRGAAQARADSLRAEARSLTVEARGIWQEMERLDEQRASFGRDAAELAGAEEAHRRQIEAMADAPARHASLDALAGETAQLAVRGALLDRTDAVISAYAEKVDALVSRPARLEAWPEAAGDLDQLASVRDSVARALEHLEIAVRDLERARDAVRVLRETATATRVEADARARAVRAELEAWKQGSGALARRVAELRERSGQLAALTALRTDLDERRATVLQRRDALLDALDEVSQGEYDARRAVANSLNTALHPRIDVRVEQSGLPTRYVEALRTALRGSGLRYNTLAPLLAERMSPRELTTAAERREAQSVAEITGITLDRAARLLAEVAANGAEDIVTCEVQDTVTLSLLDGVDYKTTEHLSTGQRCTVVLPLLLSHQRNVLVIDQPEDHLDNAFVVETAVEALRRRAPDGQLIFSTHNPNIPVLGEADTVVLMGSDGRRGFVRHAGRLDDAESVRAITAVMEGGLGAFQRRSSFYHSVAGPGGGD